MSGYRTPRSVEVGDEEPAKPRPARAVCIAQGSPYVRYDDGEPFYPGNEWMTLPAERADQWDVELWRPL